MDNKSFWYESSPLPSPRLLYSLARSLLFLFSLVLDRRAWRQNKKRNSRSLELRRADADGWQTRRCSPTQWQSNQSRRPTSCEEASVGDWISAGWVSRELICRRENIHQKDRKSVV